MNVGGDVWRHAWIVCCTNLTNVDTCRTRAGSLPLLRVVFASTNWYKYVDLKNSTKQDLTLDFPFFTPSSLPGTRVMI